MNSTKFPKGSIITSIKRGKGKREHLTYACIIAPSGELLVSATLDYCCEVIQDRGIED